MIKVYEEREPTLKEVQGIVKRWVEGLTLANGDGFFRGVWCKDWL